MKEKACSFIGHRKINYSDELEKKLEEIIENLIVNFGVYEFLFGSLSEFNDLCHKVVTRLKEKYPKIKRIMFSCKSELCVLENDRKQVEMLYSKAVGHKVYILGFEEEFEFKSKYISGRASYIERNKAMIDESDFCIFYYNASYSPPLRKFSKKAIGFYQPKSGTKHSFDYANQQKKNIINTFEN